MANKFNANRSVYDDMVWDSDLELNVYKWLKKHLIYSDAEITLHIKPGVVIKPRCNVFDTRKWKCDFKLASATTHINLEVKGFPTNQFRLTLEMLEACNPSEFKRTYILTNNKLVKDRYKKMGDRIIMLSELSTEFLNTSNWSHG